MVMELKKIVERFGVKESESIICVNTILLEIEKHKSIPMQLPVILGLRHKYSGEDSKLFWKYVAASGERKGEFYSLGVALQNLEEFVLKLMKDACPNFVESKQASK